MTTTRARRLWHLIEPYHATVYFEPTAKSIYERAGLKGGWMGYFASRAAALGAVGPEVVVSTFYNFHPNMVRRAIPDAWSFSSPARVLEARFEVADTALRRLLGPMVTAPSLGRAADLARAVAMECEPGGRPLFAAHSGLEWPVEPHLALWHAATLLREFRGDGHVALLVGHEVDGCEAHVLVVAAGVSTADLQRSSRGWSTEEGDAAVERLRARGIVEGGGELTPDGRRLRDEIEAGTDRLALPPAWTARAPELDELERLLGEIARPLVEGDALPFPNPMGLTRPR